MSDLSATQNILIRLESKVDYIKQTMDKNAASIESIPVIKYQQEQHHTAIGKNTDDLRDMAGDINKAKGIAALLGAGMGFLAGLFKH